MDSSSQPLLPSHYEERPAPPSLASLVACVWSQRASEDRVQRVVPDGCVDLLWITTDVGVRAQVAGPDTAVHLEALPQGTELAGVRFRPGAAAGVLGLPLHALRDTRPLLSDLWGPSEAAVTERVAAAWPAAPAATPAGLEAVAAAAAAAVGDRLREQAKAGSRPRLPWSPSAGPALAEALMARNGPGSVRALATDLGLSERQLHRRCLATFGYGPKTVQRVLRFQAALRAGRQGRRLADVAADVGYADQAHMARDVRALAGVPLTDLIAA